MYQRNSQYYSSQQVPQNAQISSGYLPQQLQQGYAMPSNVLSQLQQQRTQVPLQQAVRFSSNPDTTNTLRRPSKGNSIPQVDSLQIPSLPTQTQPWLLNGSLSAHQQTQQWQHRPEQPSAVHSDPCNFSIAHSSRSKTLASTLTHPQVFGLQSGIRTQPQITRTQGNGLSPALQPSQSSRLISPPLTQRLASTSGLASSLHSLEPDSLAQMRQIFGRSVSIPPNIMQSSNTSILHSSNRSTHDLGVNFLSHSGHQSLQQSMQSGISSKPVSSQSEKRDKIHIRFDQKVSNSIKYKYFYG